MNINNTVCELTLGATGSNWTFFDAGWGTNGGYLCAASSSSNYLRTQASNNANSQWSITLGANGIATIKAQGSYSHNLLKYNNSSNIFSCYASGSTQLDVCLFRRTEIYDYPAEQTIELAAGWNWWSTFLDTDLDQLKAALLSALPGANSITIKSQTQSTTYNGAYWRGQLNAIDVAQMYEIHTPESCAILLTGLPIDPTELSVTIRSGNNWIAFPFSESMTINQAFSTFPVNGDIIKSKEGRATYNGTMWRGTLSTLEPGQGYIYKSNATSVRTFTFPVR